MKDHSRDKPGSLVDSQRRQPSYNAISSTETNEASPLFDLHGHTDAMMMDQGRRDDSDDLLSSHRRDRRCSRAGLIFGAALVVGALLWLTTYTYAHTSRLGYWDDYSSDDDNDGYTYTYTYERRSLADMVLPLLGRSHENSAQQEADHAKDYLNSKGHLLGSPHEEDKVTEGCEATVIVLRHCEKGDIREHCNYIGYERSVYLASLFGDDKADKWPAPSYLFAEAPSMRRNPEKRNFRELETILPLSEKFDIDVDSTYNSMDSGKLGRRIFGLLQSGDMCGKVS
jgi:hypothetical protein